MKRLVRMNRFVALTLAFVMAMYALAPLSVAAATKASVAAQATGALVPIVFNSADGAFSGVFNITRFVVQNGQVVATGRLTGTVTDALGAVVGTINQALSLPVLRNATTGSVDILNLVLGPLSLDLLGLQVDLSRVVLNITAQSGPGNLLGNLLVAVAGLLDGNGNALGLLRNLLNDILGQL